MAINSYLLLEEIEGNGNTWETICVRRFPFEMPSCIEKKISRENQTFSVLVVKTKLFRNGVTYISVYQTDCRIVIAILNF